MSFSRPGPRPTEAAVAACVAALRGGGKILAMGNGGSAAEAQHFTAELVNKFSRPRPGLRAVTLSTDTSVLTSIANDISFDAVFSRQIEALGDRGDVALALTTSGNSPNILRALRAAREKGMKSIALTGMGGGQICRPSGFPAGCHFPGDAAGSGSPPCDRPYSGCRYRGRAGLLIRPYRPNEPKNVVLMCQKTTNCRPRRLFNIIYNCL